MESNLVRGIDRAYSERTDLIVFALTGRTGSGCTTAATTLSKPFAEIALNQDDLSEIEQRKFDIVAAYAKSQWVPFETVTVSSVIFSFLLQEPEEKIGPYLVEQKISPKGRQELTEHLSALRHHTAHSAFRRAVMGNGSPEDLVAGWEFIKELHVRAQQTKRVLAAEYPPLFQLLGDNLRFSGSVLDSSVKPERLFELMDRIRTLINCAAAHQKSTSGASGRVVVDAIRNPLELVYLRKHISGLYVLAVSVDDNTRRSRLVESGYNKKDIDRIDEKEYPASKHLDDYTSFVSQNLRDCIQKADVFVANPGSSEKLASSVRSMNTQLVRYVALALRPGLVTPTRDERCMQIAFVAKLNSGCISRQVGAVVTDKEHSLHAIGWNDTPKGQTACLLRDVSSLLSGLDDVSFSDYEKTDVKLRTHLDQKFKRREDILEREGLRCPFCFKDAYNTVMKERNQVHTRSLHAEENAFLQVAKRGSSGIGGGVLYTTASPCELCSKKAYQLGIKEIVYVDPYPGISVNHVLRSGASESQPVLRLFSGAVGHAYHRLYESLLSIKDEFGARLAG